MHLRIEKDFSVAEVRALERAGEVSVRQVRVVGLRDQDAEADVVVVEEVV